MVFLSPTLKHDRGDKCKVLVVRPIQLYEFYVYKFLNSWIGQAPRLRSQQTNDCERKKKERLSSFPCTTSEPEYAGIAFLVFPAVKHSNPISLSVSPCNRCLEVRKSLKRARNRYRKRIGVNQITSL